MKVNNHLTNAVLSTNGKTKYDAGVKEVLSDKQILAWIMQGAVKEFEGMSVEDIISCIEGEPEVASVPVNPGLTQEVIAGLKNESIIPNEGMVTYDVRFYAVTPNEERIKILLNVEAQKKYNPGYDIVTRAIFYCARMLSAQLDTEFSATNYDEIKKVYSIWISMDSPDYAADTITQYSIEKKQLYGEFKGKARYDLLSAVMVCLAKDGKSENGSKLHQMLETLLSDRISAEEKISSLHKDYGMETSKNLEAEVRSMCNLSDLIEERGIEKGIEQGIAQGMEQGITQGIEQVAVRLITSGDTNEKIHMVTNLSMERIAELREQELCMV